LDARIVRFEAKTAGNLVNVVA